MHTSIGSDWNFSYCTTAMIDINSLIYYLNGPCLYHWPSICTIVYLSGLSPGLHIVQLLYFLMEMTSRKVCYYCTFDGDDKQKSIVSIATVCYCYYNIEHTYYKKLKITYRCRLQVIRTLVGSRVSFVRCPCWTLCTVYMDMKLGLWTSGIWRVNNLLCCGSMCKLGVRP